MSEFAAWPVDDLDNAIGLRAYRNESCSNCGTHPSVTRPDLGGHPNAVTAVWRHCRVCELIESAQAAGPPEPSIKGWRIELQRHEHPPGAGRRRAPA